MTRIAHLAIFAFAVLVSLAALHMINKAFEGFTHCKVMDACPVETQMEGTR